MSKDELRSLLKPRGFRPFRLHLVDGDSLDVPHPEFAALSPNGRTLILFDAESGGMREIVDTLLIVSVDFGTPASSEGL